MKANLEAAMDSLRHVDDDEVLTVLAEVFGLGEWMAQGSAARS
jgi:hypothetical protein